MEKRMVARKPSAVLNRNWAAFDLSLNFENALGAKR